eukprot:TRINITY_DN8059_c0_g1_i1.p1 TRINITY_DN8059_c0_g1~~TRINITY_DN8059_c0_g1_i1.p1  ORF type:complete len:567 (+),score=91.92 TRINITY_DN8059_c0_g1_i1:309-2009(+)
MSSFLSINNTRQRNINFLKKSMYRNGNTINSYNMSQYLIIVNTTTKHEKKRNCRSHVTDFYINDTDIVVATTNEGLVIFPEIFDYATKIMFPHYKPIVVAFGQDRVYFTCALNRKLYSIDEHFNIHPLSDMLMLRNTVISNGECVALITKKQYKVFNGISGEFLDLNLDEYYVGNSPVLFVTIVGSILILLKIEKIVFVDLTSENDDIVLNSKGYPIKLIPNEARTHVLLMYSTGEIEKISLQNGRRKLVYLPDDLEERSQQNLIEQLRGQIRLMYSFNEYIILCGEIIMLVKTKGNPSKNIEWWEEKKVLNADFDGKYIYARTKSHWHRWELEKITNKNHKQNSTLRRNFFKSRNKSIFGDCKDRTKIIQKKLYKIEKNALRMYPGFEMLKFSCTVTDCLSPDNPIIFVNDEFVKMTQYEREECVGINCRFLQGKHTSRETVDEIRFAIENELELDVNILNYRKDGTPFWNIFRIFPIYNQKGKLISFIALQKDMTDIKIGNEPSNWSPIELALWLDHINMGKYSHRAAELRKYKGLTSEILASLEVTETDMDHIMLNYEKIVQN